jgi:hypothetical protein
MAQAFTNHAGVRAGFWLAAIIAVVALLPIIVIYEQTNHVLSVKVWLNGTIPQSSSLAIL